MRRAECWLSPHCDGEEELINRHQEGYRTSTNNAAARSFMSISTRMLMLLQSLVWQWRWELSALRCTLKKKLCLVGLWGSVVAIGPRSSTLSFSSSSWPSLYEVKHLLTVCLGFVSGLWTDPSFTVVYPQLWVLHKLFQIFPLQHWVLTITVILS